MSSNSELRKFFLRPPQGPLRSHISGSKKACNDSAGIEVDKQQQAQRCSAAAEELHKQRINSSSFPTDSIHCLTATLGRLFERVLYANRLARRLSRFSPAVG